MKVETTIGERIKKARKEAGLTQKQLAEKIGKGYSTVQKYELNLVSPSLPIILLIADVLEISWGHLAGLRLPSDDPDLTEDEEFNLNRKEYKRHKTWKHNYDMVESIIAELYGGVEKRIITGEASGIGITVFGQGDNAFSLDDEDIDRLSTGIQGLVRATVDHLIEAKEVSLEEEIRLIKESLDDPNEVERVRGWEKDLEAERRGRKKE